VKSLAAIVMLQKVRMRSDPTTTSPPPNPLKPVEYPTGPTEREVELYERLYKIEPVRDHVMPLVVFALGLAVYMANYFKHYRLDPFEFSGVAVIVSLIAVAEAAVMVAFAFFAANSLEVSFGRVVPAMLKFTAIMMVADGVTAWCNSAMSHHSGLHPSFSIGLSDDFVAVAFYCLGLAYFFKLDSEAAKKFLSILATFYVIVRTALVIGAWHSVIWIGHVPINPFGGPVPRWRS
jgi:hypothetical protein